MTAVDTTRTEHRLLHFNSIDDALAEVDRLLAAERAGTLRRSGNWTAGQVFGHLAAWINYPYDGYPSEMKPPWFVRILGRLLLKMFTSRPMRRGFRIPRIAEGTFGTQAMSAEEGARRLQAALARLKSREPARHHSPALGPMSDEQRIALNLRHAELHLGFLHP